MMGDVMAGLEAGCKGSRQLPPPRTSVADRVRTRETTDCSGAEPIRSARGSSLLCDSGAHNLVSGPIGHPGIASLATPDDLVEGLERFIDGRSSAAAVQLLGIDLVACATCPVPKALDPLPRRTFESEEKRLGLIHQCLAPSRNAAAAALPKLCSLAICRN